MGERPAINKRCLFCESTEIVEKGRCLFHVRALSRYRRALHYGKSHEEAMWHHDNPPGTCKTHPDRPSQYPQGHRCVECVSAERAGNLQRQRLKIEDRACSQCGKLFQIEKYKERVKCFDCHAQMGSKKNFGPKLPVGRPPKSSEHRQAPKQYKQKPLDGSLRRGKGQAPGYRPANYQDAAPVERIVVPPGIVTRVCAPALPSLRCEASGLMRDFCGCGGKACGG